ncbi:MAG TPA: FAD-dependent oxidoreductase [Tissierellaceae bacterium]|nr:FAD-dependent oxidoreductase [Tissierellaceae bacterium]
MKTDNIITELINNYGDWFNDEAHLESGKMTKELYPYNSIFNPIEINRLKIKNRLVMAPMGNISMCDETGRPSDQMIDYFVERAKGGVGLITTGLVPVSQGIDPTVVEPGGLTYFPRIDRSRSVFAGWRDLAAGVHNHGSKIFIQLTPGLGRVGNPQCLLTLKKLPKSASWNPNFYIPQIPSSPLSNRQLKRIIKNAGQASADAKAANIDGVYLHGHEGYLLEQLTNPAFNRRKTGRYSDWQAFGLDLIKEIRDRVGPDYPIMYRIDLSLALNETYGEKMNNKSLRKFKDGRTIDMTLDYMKNLVKEGVDIFDVDLGCYDNWWLPHPPAGMPPGCFLEISKIAKDFFKENNILSNAGKEVPVVAVGKLGYPDLAEQALRDNKCDMIMLGRPLLADPYWPDKVYKGQVEDILPCIGCQEGCINEFVEGGHPQCAVNPRTSFEYSMPLNPPAADVVKNIGVIGAGPAGVVAATTLAKRGHKVSLIEKTGDIGGKVIAGSIPKIKYEFDNYKKYLERQVEEMSKLENFKYLPNTEATTSWLKDENFDSIIFANGAKEIIPPFKNMDKANVIEATELLRNPDLIGDAKSVVVIGGGVVGCETAYWLKYEYDLDVKVVEMEKYFMNHVCTANRGHLIYYLEKEGVELLNCTKVTAFDENAVKVVQNVSDTVPDPYLVWHPILPENIKNPLAPKVEVEEEEKTIEADLFVMAIGNRPENHLYFEAQEQMIAQEIFNIGDSFRSGKVLEATRAANAVARTI